MSLIKKLKLFKIKEIFSLFMIVSNVIFCFGLLSFNIMYISASFLNFIFNIEDSININYTLLSINFFSFVLLTIFMLFFNYEFDKINKLIKNELNNNINPMDQNYVLKFINKNKEHYFSDINQNFIHFDFENQQEIFKNKIFNTLCLNKNRLIYQNYENFIKKIHDDRIDDLYYNVTLLFYKTNTPELNTIKDRLYKIYDRDNRFKVIETGSENITYLELLHYLRNKKIENVMLWKYMIKNHKTTDIENDIFGLKKNENNPSEETYLKFVLNVFKEMTIENQLESLKSSEFIRYIKEELSFLDKKYTLKEAYNDYFKELIDIIDNKNLEEYNLVIVDLFQELEEETIQQLRHKLEVKKIEENNFKIIHI